MIVEDEVFIAEGLRRALDASGYEVTGCAADGREAVEMAIYSMPDVILMDVLLPGDIDGIAAARAIHESMDVPIIYITGHSSDALVDDAIKAGADGYVVKPFQLRQVTSAIKVALRHRKGDERPESGRPPADHGGTEPFAMVLKRLQAALDDNWPRSNTDGASGGLPSVPSITPREREVISGLVCYRRLSTVADVLGISVHTARNHLKSVFRKLNLHSQDELMRFLIEGGGESV
jgi:DNA-binding NarL/FixJ family response regulator